MSDYYLPGHFDSEVDRKLAEWRDQYPDLAARTPADVWGLIAREVKKYGRGTYGPDRERQKLITVAAMAKLGYMNTNGRDRSPQEES